MNNSRSPGSARDAQFALHQQLLAELRAAVLMLIEAGRRRGHPAQSIVLLETIGTALGVLQAGSRGDRTGGHELRRSLRDLLKHRRIYELTPIGHDDRDDIRGALHAWIAAIGEEIGDPKAMPVMEDIRPE